MTGETTVRARIVAWWEQLRRRIAIVVAPAQCVVVSGPRLQELSAEAEMLVLYVETSGGLRDPHRIRAYDRVVTSAHYLEKLASLLRAEYYEKEC